MTENITGPTQDEPRQDGVEPQTGESASPCRVEVSVVVPAYNEADSVKPLLKELAEKLGPEYEVVFVDDGSFDGTFETAEGLKGEYPFLRLCRHSRNLGKTAAIQTGFEASRGDIITVFDADLQFDPEDVIRQVEKVREGFDLVTGQKRGQYEKRFVSAVYNRMARKLFGLKVRDINALKTFRREVLAGMRLRKDWHRYIVPLAAARGFSVTEIPVLLRPRLYGEPKYSSPFRVFVGFFDLMAVGFQLTFMRKPMLYFGSMGTVALFLGFLTGLVAIILRLFGHGFRPVLYLVMLLVVAGLVLFAAGLMGESLAVVNDRLEGIERALANRDTDRHEDPRGDGR
jgi:glycosyltransferase involved in cell wall biosynthesis